MNHQRPSETPLHMTIEHQRHVRARDLQPCRPHPPSRRPGAASTPPDSSATTREKSHPIPRRQFLATLASTGAPFVWPGAPRAGDAPAVRFGLIADVQYADADEAGTRFYRQSVAKLTEAIAHFNQLDLAFCVNLGDLIDRDWRSFDTILAPVASSRHVFHHVLGSHDCEVAAAEKIRVPDRLGRTRRYDTIDHGAWCVVLLDTNDVSLYAHPESTPMHAGAEAALKALRATGAPQAQTWNGGVSDRQLQWFESTCQAAAEAGRRVIVLAHHPVHPDGAHNVWNAPRLLDVVDRHRNVVAWLNGHNHAGAFGLRNGVAYITLPGMVETRDTSAFAVLDVSADRLALVGHGRAPSHEIALR